MPFQGVFTHFLVPRALPWAMSFLAFQAVAVHCFHNLRKLSHFTNTTKYLLVDQNSCGSVMRSTYCLLASRCRV